ncbi:hypothetical protein [Mycolicibacterium sp.]|uniref:hypothetical protein n=1 Tax=Mycolicibacterium sp. TaxID=2320850 RepID=UPI00355D2ED0
MPGISLETDGSGWGGTFTRVVTAAAKDLLSDAAAIDIHVIADDRPVSGRLTDVAGGFLVIENRRIPLDDVTGFYVD